MTDKQITEQIAAIRDATAQAMVSRESAAAFLREAGIIGDGNSKVVSPNIRNSNTKKKA